MLKAAVVIPNLNGEAFLPHCLDSLKKQSMDHTIIVVDNASRDKSLDIIKSDKDIVCLEQSTNLGFAGGVNVGITHAINAGFDYIALLNNDAVVETSWLKELVSAIDSGPATGIVTSKILRADRKHLDSTGDYYSIWGLPFPRGRNEVDTNQYDKSLSVFGASGGASIYRASMLQEIGLFDEDFFAYFEDVDISFRARARGWQILYEPKAIAEHKVGGTSSTMGDFTHYHSTKNFLLLYARNMPTRLYFKYLPLFGIQFIRLTLGAILHKKTKAHVKGVVAAIKLHRATRRIRKKNLSLQTISNTELDGLLVHSRPPKPPAII